MYTSFTAILSACYPALLFIMFLSCGIFLHISTPTANCRISTYVMYYYYYYYYYYYIIRVLYMFC